MDLRRKMRGNKPIRVKVMKAQGVSQTSWNPGERSENVGKKINQSVNQSTINCCGLVEVDTYGKFNKIETQIIQKIILRRSYLKEKADQNPWRISSCDLVQRPVVCTGYFMSNLVTTVIP